MRPEPSGWRSGAAPAARRAGRKCSDRQRAGGAPGGRFSQGARIADECPDLCGEILSARVHFSPGPNTRSLNLIIDTYGTRAIGLPVVIIPFAIAATLTVMAVMAVQTIWVRRVSGRW